jgi:hypothetical protein
LVSVIENITARFQAPSDNPSCDADEYDPITWFLSIALPLFALWHFCKLETLMSVSYLPYYTSGVLCYVSAGNF